MSGCLRLERTRNWRWLNEARVSIWGEENILELESGDGATAL